MLRAPRPRFHRSLLARTALLQAMLGLGSASFGASLLTWNITGTTGASGGSAPASLAVGLSGSALAAGGSTGNSTSPANTWNRSFALAADAAAAQTAGNIFSWTTTVEAGYTATFNGLTGLNLSRTSVGPASAELYYSTDGVTYVKTGSTATVTTTLTSAATAFDDTIATTPLVLNGQSAPATLYWRLVVYGGTSANRLGIGNAGTDDFTLLGTVTGGSAKDLSWTGGDGAWNTSAGNTPWTFSGSPSAFSTNDNVAIATPGTLTVDAGGVATGTVSVANSTGVVTFTGGSVTGTTLAKSAAGTLALDAPNTFSGGVSITGGVVRLGNPGAFGTQGASFNGATLDFAPAVATFANTLGIGQGDATVNVGVDATVTFSGVISASNVSAGAGIARGDPLTFNTVVKTGAGKLLLNANVGAQMAYDTTAQNISAAGGIALQISVGTVELGNNRTFNLASGIVRDGTDSETGLPTVYNGMQWDGGVLLRGATVQINGGNIRGSGVITVGVIGQAAATNTLAHRFNFNSPDIANPVVVSDGHTLTLSAALGGSIVLSGPVSGGGTITNAGTGTARVSSTTPSTFTGTFTNIGRMELSAPALAAAAAVNNAATLTIDNRSTEAGAIIAAPISGAGSVTKTSDGSVVFTGANTFSGGLVLASSGGVFVNDPAALGSGVISSSHAGGKVGLASGSASSVTIGQTLSTGVANLETNFHPALAFEPGEGKTIVLAGSISGSGQLKVSGGGNLDLTAQTAATNTNTGGIEVGSGRILVAGDDNLGAGTINFGTIGNSSLVASGGGASVTLSRDITIGSTVSSGYAAILDSNGKTFGLTGSISDRAGNAFGGALRKTGAGQLTLAGALSYGGDTTVDTGTLRLETVNAANESSAIHIAIIDARLDLAFAGSDTVGKLYIGSTQQNAGTYGATGSGATHIDDTRFAGPGVLTVTTGPVVADPYASWASGYGLNGASAEKTADPDADGLNNLLEYATHTDPTQSGPAAVTLGRSGNALTLTYTRIADPALTYTVEATNDLASAWTTVAVGGNPSTGSANLAGDVTIADTVSVTAQPRRFLRLRINQ